MVFAPKRLYLKRKWIVDGFRHEVSFWFLIHLLQEIVTVSKMRCFALN